MQEKQLKFEDSELCNVGEKTSQRSSDFRLEVISASGCIRSQEAFSEGDLHGSGQHCPLMLTGETTPEQISCCVQEQDSS